MALITGGAGGIGLATARRLMDEGACVVLCDIDREALHDAEDELREQYGADVVASCWVDVTREDAVVAGFRDSAWKFGGVDICISNAGIASASPVDETSLATWQKNMDILATGYFLIARQAFQLLEGAGHRRLDRLHRLEERAGRLARRRCVLHGQGGRAASRPLPGARRRAARHSRQRRQSGRRAARLAHLAGRMGAAARRAVQDQRRTSSKRCTASAAC